MLNQIANYLQISTSQIVRCDEWAKVYFVVVAGCRPTFISKKVVMEIDNRIPKTLEEAKEATGMLFHHWDEEARQLTQQLVDAGWNNEGSVYPGFSKEMCDRLFVYSQKVGDSRTTCVCAWVAAMINGKSLEEVRGY